MLRNWRVRSRLVLLIAIPTATAVALGGSSIVSSWRSAISYQRIATLAQLSSKVTALAYELEYERDATVWYIADKTDPNTGLLTTKLSAKARDQLQVVRSQYKFTDRAVGPVRTGVATISSNYPPGVVQDARSVGAVLGALGDVRSATLSAQANAVDVINRYSRLINVLLAFDDQIALTSSDPQLTSTVSALTQVSRIEDEYSTQRAVIVFGLTVGKFLPRQIMLGMLTNSVANQSSDYSQFLNFASPWQSRDYTVNLDSNSLKDRVSASEASVIQYAPTHTLLTAIGISPDEWFGSVRDTISQIRKVEKGLVHQAVSRAEQLHKRAIVGAILIGAAVLLVLIISLLFTVIVGRSMVRPLRRLRAGALEVAGLRLPETVRRMSESDSEQAPADVDPIDVDSFDEIGEVARAFDQVHREAMRLAANEAALRGNINAMFVNLSRRSQSLVERQIRLIDELEQGEQEPERLASLFQMDHLATRMRRNSENLLVLAGHDSSRRWNQPVPLVDVLRAAISEIEQYERVTLNVQPGIAVHGPAVNDVVHLIAELAENATSFSSADTPVSVSGHVLTSGGVLLDITDLGVGMGSEEMAHANWRLDNPPVVDVAVSRRMGLFVVARLAARHGIRVRLRPASGAGLTALVWLPDEVVVREGATRPGGQGRFPEPLSRFAIGQGLADVGAAQGVQVASAASTSEWPAAGAGGPSTAEQEVAAARTPRFGGAEENGSARSSLGPQRVPGANLHPGLFGAGQDAAASSDSEAFAGPSADPAESEADLSGGSAKEPADAPTDLFGTGELAAFRPRTADEDSDQAGIAGLGDGGDQPLAWGDQPPLSSEWTSDLPVSMWGSPSPSAPAAEPAGAELAGAEHPAAEASAAEASADNAGQDSVAAAGEHQPAEPAEPAVLGAPLAAARGSFLGQDAQASSNGGVVLPPAAMDQENRLPIFEAVESDWFRRGRPSVETPVGQPGQPSHPATPAPAWTSPADEGWKAAEAAVVPASAGTTVAGLPRRVPKANLIPGTAQESTAPAPVRSAAATRDRFASLQRGMREGRAASGASKDEGTSDVPDEG
jgi:signal transduction histidine kinase